MKGLLLAGGSGTRLRPLTFTGNKHMIPIANEPMLFYGLRHLAEAGIREVAIVLGTLHEGIEEAVGDGAAFGLRVSYIHQGAPKGLADAVRCSRGFLGSEPFVMYLGDNLLQEGAKPLVASFNEDPSAAVIGVTPVADPSQYGVVELDGESIVSIVEKPRKPRSRLALIGVYLFTEAIHPIIERLTPSARGELEITDAIWRLHETGARIRVRPVEGWWKDTGRPEDLLEANERVLQNAPSARFTRRGTISESARLDGSVGVGEGAMIEAGATIRGPVVIGRNCRVGAESLIGPFTALGDGVQVDACEVQRSIVMERSALRGAFRLTNSILGRDAHVEARRPMDATIICILGDSARVVL